MSWIGYKISHVGSGFFVNSVFNVLVFLHPHRQQWDLAKQTVLLPKLSWDPAWFHPLPQGRMEPQASQGPLGAEGNCGILSLLLPSPQSEAMTHEMEELSLQPTQNLPPLNERKNGKDVEVLLFRLCLYFCLHLSFSHSPHRSAWLTNFEM